MINLYCTSELSVRLKHLYSVAIHARDEILEEY